MSIFGSNISVYRAICGCLLSSVFILIMACDRKLRRRRRELANDQGTAPQLQSLLRPGVSMNSLKQILARLRTSDDLDELVGSSSESISAALHQKMSACLRYDSLPPTAGGEVEITWADPMKLMQVCLESSRNLRDLYSTAAVHKPPTMSSPWSIVLTFDEYMPGNKFLGARNRHELRI